MQQQNLVLQSVKLILWDFLGDFVKFPIWWYSKGTARAFMFAVHGVRNAEKSLGLSVWTKNLFRPMFGQHDWQGRIISFFMRLAQIIFKSIFLLIYSILLFVIFIIWLLLPVFVVYMIVHTVGVSVVDVAAQ